jgi:hypothetical protein
MPEEITETSPATAPVEAIAAAAQPESQPEPPEFQVERFTVAATFAPPSANDDARTIDAVWYTGVKVPRFDWRTGEEYDLILDMKGCRMDRLNNGGPVLDSHSAYGVESQLGVVRKAWAKKATGLATIQFSKRDAVTPIWNDVRAGIIQNLSPGMWIYKKVDTTPKGQERKEFTATDWEPFEISLLSVPADAATNFMSAAGTPPAPPSAVETQRASAHTKEKPDMETATQDAGVGPRRLRQRDPRVSGAFGALHGTHLQPLVAIQAIHPLGVYPPAFAPQQHRQPPVSVSDSGPGQLPQPHPQLGLGIAPALIPIDPARDADQPARALLAQLVALANLAHQLAPRHGLQAFFDSTSCSMCLSSVRSATSVFSFRFSSRN